MPATAEKLEELPSVDTSSLRRFEIPDLDRHREWFLPRIRAAYKHLNDRQLVGWLRGICHSNEFQFLYQDTCVGMFQIMSAHTLMPQPTIYERFVFCADKDNVEHQKQAAQFYAEAAKWGRFQAAGAIIVEQMSDVPHEMIRAVTGRLMTRQEVYHPL